VAEVLVDEAERDLLERGVDRGDLGEDVAAVGVVVVVEAQVNALRAQAGALGRVVAFLPASDRRAAVTRRSERA
jgi:hypothetical protein